MEISELPGDPHEVILTAAIDGEELGLVIAERLTGARVATIKSIVVTRTHRRCGIATQLIDAVAQRMRAAGVERLEAMYGQTQQAKIDIIEGLLKKAGFCWPISGMIVARGDRRVLGARWARAQIKAPYAIRPWPHIDAHQLEPLRPATWFPDALGPFLDVPAEPLNSLALVKGDEIVGWCLTHRLAADTIRYSRLFVHPAHRTGQNGIAMVVDAIRRQDATNVPYGLFGVRADNPGMLSFTRRILAPYLLSMEEIRYAEKSLQPLGDRKIDP
ncbi:MAG: GNAT family N-acetyltransferase [Myxococcota bacterium]